MDSFNELCLKWWEGFYSSFQNSCTMTCVSDDGALDMKPGEISILLGIGGAEASNFLNTCGIPDINVILFNRVLCQIETLCLPKIILMYEQYKSSLHLENKSDGMVIDTFQISDQDDGPCQRNPDSDVKDGCSPRIEHLEIISAGDDYCLRPATSELPVSGNVQGLSSMTILIQSSERTKPHLERTSSTMLEVMSSESGKDVISTSEDHGIVDNEEKEICDEKVVLEPTTSCDKSKEKSLECFPEKDTDQTSVMLEKEEPLDGVTLAETKESHFDALKEGMQIQEETEGKKDSEGENHREKTHSELFGQIRRSSRQIRVSAKFADDRENIRKLIKPEISKNTESTYSGDLQCICSTCRAVFSDPAKLRIHWRSHKENRAKKKSMSFLCLKCELSFSSQQKVKAHYCSKEPTSQSQKNQTLIKQNKELSKAVSQDHDSEKHENHENIKEPEDVRNVSHRDNEVNESVMNPLNDALYTCDVCSLSFQTNQLLKTHFLTHGRKPHKCSECGKDFRQKKALSYHKSTKHNSAELFQCTKCSKSFLEASALEKHMEIHSGKKSFFCEVCGKGFYRQQSWLNHQKWHETMNKFQCQQCGKSFIDKRSLAAHHSVHTGEKPHVCEICGKRFRIVRGLINHSRIHDKSAHYKCEHCPKTFIEKRSLEAHKLAHSGVKPFFCDICGKTFRRELGLLNHSRLHDESKAFKCEVCNKSFVDKWGMLKHKSIHTGEKPFTCDVCGKSFRIKKGLHDHVKLHNKELQYHCDLCPRTFVEKRKLDIHLRAHRGEKAYVCDQCGQRFMNTMTLKVHKRRHTGEKPYKCSFCDKAFNQQGTLIAHERYHKGEKPYVCEVCGEGYVTKSHLTIHRRKHFNDRPYKCEQCDYAAFTFSLLRTHMLKHSSEKPFKCHMCTAAFKRPHHLDVHMRTHLSSEKLFQCDYCDEAFDSNKKCSAHLASHEIVVVTPHPGSDEIFNTQGPGEVAYDIVLLS